MAGIKLRGVSSCVPTKVVTNDDLSKIVDTSDEWITTRTGIKSRRVCEDESFFELCINSAKSALKRSGVSADEIGACIVATFTSDAAIPSSACLLQRELGLPEDIPCFDLNAACTGFVYALHTMECLLSNSSRKFGLVVGADAVSKAIDWSDRSTCILFGD